MGSKSDLLLLGAGGPAAAVESPATERQHIIIGDVGVPVYFNEVADRQHILTSIYYGEDL